MILKQYTSPTTEPIHLTEAKMHLRAGGSVSEAGAVLYTAENTLLSAQIMAARMAAETEQWRSLVLQTWDLYLDEFPGDNFIELPLPPLRAVEFVRYTDSAGAISTFEDYTVDKASDHGRIVLDYESSWPSATLAPNNPVHIRFQCGYLIPFTSATETTLSIPNNPLEVGEKVRLTVSGGTLPGNFALLTDYYATATGLSLTDGGEDVTPSGYGTGAMFIGELPQSTKIGMLLVLTDLYENRADTVIGRSNTVQTLPRGASHWFSMDTAKRF